MAFDTIRGRFLYALNKIQNQWRMNIAKGAILRFTVESSYFCYYKKTKMATRQSQAAIDCKSYFWSKTRRKNDFPCSTVSEFSLKCQLVCALFRNDVKAVDTLCSAFDVWTSANSTFVWPDSQCFLIDLFNETKYCMFFYRTWMCTLSETDQQKQMYWYLLSTINFQGPVREMQVCQGITTVLWTILTCSRSP
jgi:hypothetical protein